MTVTIFTYFQAEAHGLQNSQYSVHSEHQSRGSGPRLESAAILEMVNLSVCFGFSLLDRVQATSDYSLSPQENANANDIHGRLQAQFADDIHSIRSVRR
jgi:hypothetical protein